MIGNNKCSDAEVSKEPPAPIHPFEVRISIGGETWDYVIRQLKEIAYDSEHRTPGTFQGFGGGGGGSYSVTTAVRDISPTDYRDELLKWRENLPPIRTK